MKKSRQKNFKIFGPPLGLPRYPTSGSPDRISKKPSIKPRVTRLGWPMQNFGQFGPVVSSIEGLRTKKVAAHFVKRRNLYYRFIPSYSFPLLLLLIPPPLSPPLLFITPSSSFSSPFPPHSLLRFFTSLPPPILPAGPAGTRPTPGHLR